MSVLVVFLFAFVLGFVGSMPVAGPIAVLLVLRSLDGRFGSAWRIGIGSVCAEALYASLAFWGFATLLSLHPWMVPLSHALAGVILLVLGLSMLRHRTEPDREADEAHAGAGSTALGFLVSALNPSVIVAWAGAATVLYSTGLVDVEPVLAVPFGLGAGLGILGWYIVLIHLLRRLKGRFSKVVLHRTVAGFGVVVLALAGWFFWRFAVELQNWS